MTVYHRYVVTDSFSLTFPALEGGMAALHSDYALENGLLLRGGKECGVLDLTYRGNPVCDDDLDLLARQAARQGLQLSVGDSLARARCILAVQPLEDDSSSLEPLWQWLFEHRAGIVVLDGGIFRDRHGIMR